MEKWAWWIVAAWAAGGCVSSATSGALESVEARLAAPEARGEVAPAREAPPGSCRAIAAQVLASHPALDALRARARASVAEARAVGALPAPELMLELWDFPIGDPQLADREGMYMVGLAQSLPPAGALDARARAAAEDAGAMLAELAERRRELRAEVLHACTDYAAARELDARLAAAEELLARTEEALRARLSTGGVSLGDVARLRAEQARVRRMRAEESAHAAHSAGQLEAWLDTAQVSLDAVTLDELASAAADDGTDSNLEADALATRGAIEAARARARAEAARADAAAAEASVPMFRVAATYMQMPSARAGLGAALSMTLPWLWSGENAARDAARARADAEVDAARAIERALRIEVAGARGALRIAQRALAVLRDEERPATELALEARSAELASGAAVLFEWLEAARALRELDVEEARLRSELAHAWVELESAVGAELATAPAGGAR